MKKLTYASSLWIHETENYKVPHVYPPFKTVHITV